MFAVGTDWAQITWSALGSGEVTVEVPGVVSESTTADGGPGSIVVTDLPSGTDLEARVDGRSLRFSTLERPPGELLARVATVSDCHLGAPSTGFFHTLREVPEPAEEVTARCLRAALVEIAARGCDLLVVKGDLVDASTAALWATAGELLDGLDIPRLVVPGNHEHSRRGDVDPFEGAAAAGVDLVRTVDSVDLADGRVRVVAADVGRAGSDAGRVDHVADDIVAAVAGSGGATMVAFHQQPMRFRVPTYIPPGIPGPGANSLLRALADTGMRGVVTSGHTHRNRRRRVHGVTVSEVASTRDFPGVWASYEFFEGGMVQAVHRIAEPSCIRWTDFTRRSALGVWAAWAPGSRDDRCFTLEW